MSRISNVDWGRVKKAYMQFASAKEMCDTFGCSIAALEQQVARGKWRKERVEANSIPAQQGAEKTSAAKPAENQSSELRELLSQEASDAIRALRQIPVERRISHLKERGQIAAAIANTAGKACGWGDGGPVQQHVNLTLLADLSINFPSQSAAAIDVAEVPQIADAETISDSPQPTQQSGLAD